jgi:hypothetical protein
MLGYDRPRNGHGEKADSQHPSHHFGRRGRVLGRPGVSKSRREIGEVLERKRRSFEEVSTGLLRGQQERQECREPVEPLRLLHLGAAAGARSQMRVKAGFFGGIETRARAFVDRGY